jgi:hypothetical protein
MWMNEDMNPNSIVWQLMMKLLCFKDVKNSICCFFVCWFCLLFYKLLRNGLGELILVMERDLYCSIEKNYGECESQLGETINAGLSR